MHVWTEKIVYLYFNILSMPNDILIKNLKQIANILLKYRKISILQWKIAFKIKIFINFAVKKINKKYFKHAEITINFISAEF